jgi:acyl-CoA synthetase (AMP-forming)/AMP-acid ligase II
MSIARALYFHSRNRPTQLAISAPSANVSYRELWTRVAGAAKEMRERGLVRGDLVALTLPGGIEYVIALHALALLEAAVLPIHPRWPAAYRSELIRFFGARAAIGEQREPDAELQFGPETFAARLEDAPLPEEAWEAPLVVSNTSGTTGAYRGVLLRQRHMLARIYARALSLGMSMHDRVMLVVEPHYSGSRNACFTALHVGATLILRLNTESPDEVVAAARDEGATLAYLVPRMSRALLSIKKGPGILFPTLRVLFSSSDRLSPEERRAIREQLNPNLYEGYATSEGGLVTLSSPADQLRYEGSVGRAVLDVELEIVNERDQPVPPGEQGSVRFRGPSVPEGYYRNPEATVERFRDGWFYPGDLAALNQEGYLFLKGRADDTIVRDGVKYLPSDVERVLAEHPKVREACVVGLPLPRGSAFVVAFVSAREPLQLAELSTYAHERLPPVRLPNRFELLDELPHTALGKVEIGELKTRAKRLLEGT